MSVFGAPLPSTAQEISHNDLLEGTVDSQPANFSSLTLEPDTDSFVDTVASAPEATTSEVVPANGSPTLTFAESAASDGFLAVTDLATVYPHALDDKQAATVYIRSIPVITLVGDELETLSAGTNPAAAAPDYHAPVSQANEILTALQTLATTHDAADIKARWDSDNDSFVVSWGSEDMLIVNDKVMLPDTTQNPAEDVLQIANRLRRLLGDAPPLARVEGLPEPSVSASQVSVVASTVSGMASWYGPGFHGRRSASGEVFNQNALTAAHRTLPFGTQVRVTNLANGQSVVVRINDRGPFGHGRIIDLSAAAASNIGLRASGVARVQLEVLSSP
ncbi:septal ring lytic transglycosylase RlpA family protein [Nodosilinea sp. LEGE 07088]|uniref:septal ring lytic transglycosylase RlpA family protein n=1 Tax=Nodosilinea sp. LEGE 07088 TaxID=2777968 RepID=UPI001D15D986|nr:septal ring lytic transglycosylase RlpA family protein [Nodosilinea sp. LEGE 07088]